MYDFRNESRRLKGWDYSNPGIYFVTISIDADIHWFGKVKNNNVILSDLGKVAHKFWSEIPDHHKKIQLGNYRIMPQHVHGIILISGQGIYKINNARSLLCRDVACNVQLDEVEYNNKPNHNNSIGERNSATRDSSDKIKCRMKKISPKSGSLSVVIRSYKSAVSKYAHENGYSEFKWQPRFYDRIIRNEKELYAIQKYIRDNPKNWNKPNG